MAPDVFGREYLKAAYLQWYAALLEFQLSVGLGSNTSDMIANDTRAFAANDDAMQ